MAKTKKSCCYSVCFLTSILINIFFVINLYLGSKWNHQVSWSQKAAEEAEKVAAISCSGHGRAYVDGLLVDGKPVCECNNCYGGPDCSEFDPDCPADADGGDPLFLEPLWLQHAASSALVVSGWHRMSYKYPGNSLILQELENQIRKVHSVARNADTRGKYVIFGVGSTQLLSAAVFALSMNLSSPARVVSEAPYYPIYKRQTDYFATSRFQFGGDATLLRNTTLKANETNIIEIVASPNNPDGKLRNATLLSPNVKMVYDRAYYWPHFTAIPHPANDDLMLFSLSKLTGHAGSRFGWALVKDKQVYERMLMYTAIAEIGVSKDTQLRALKLLKSILEGDNGGREIFNFAYEKMQRRWQNVNHVISMSTRFTIQQIAPQFCSFFEKVREPSPAYAWLKCEREEETDCKAVFDAAKITGRNGGIYGVEDRYVRLSLLKRDDDFNLLMERLAELLSKEVNGTRIMGGLDDI